MRIDGGGLLFAQLSGAGPDDEVVVDGLAVLGLGSREELFEDRSLVDHVTFYLGLPGRPALYAIILKLLGGQLVLEHRLIFVFH